MPNPSSCRYALICFRIGSLQGNSSAVFDFAYSYHRGNNMTSLQNVTYTYQMVDQLQELYNNGFAGSCTPNFCADDCVWPGDTDGAVRIRDLLPLAVGLHQTGPPRTGPMLWAPNDAYDWGPSVNGAWDYKHINTNAMRVMVVR